MKLKELIETNFEKFQNGILGSDLKEFESQLRDCKEFKDSILFINNNSSILLDEQGKRTNNLEIGTLYEHNLIRLTDKLILNDEVNLFGIKLVKVVPEESYYYIVLMITEHSYDYVDDYERSVEDCYVNK